MSGHQQPQPQQPLPWRGRRLHLVGVGGAGMSGYARAAHMLGATLTGSDAHHSPELDRLAAEGVLAGAAAVGHRPENLPSDPDVELYHSSAIPPDNPERAAARERGVPDLPRAELLAQLTALKRTIAVAGTHGKTTTSAMIVHALRAAGLDPGWLIGAPLGAELPNAHWSGGEWLVVEADESDRSMLRLRVEIALLTNVELDHHATFASLAALRSDFAAFLAEPVQAVVWDRPELLELRARGKPLQPYDAPDAQPSGGDGGGTRFGWRGNTVTLAVPGLHNAIDAAGALEAARLAGADPQSAIAGLERFTGAGRRFQPLGETARGARLFEDYAHHPTEIEATLAAARTLPHRRLVAVFQPHLFSRTKLLAERFGRALAQADIAIVLDVYPARERAADHPGVSGLTVAEATADAAGGRPVYWLPRLQDAEPVLHGLLEEGDLCLVMGAGDVDELGRGLVDAA